MKRTSLMKKYSEAIKNGTIPQLLPSQVCGTYTVVGKTQNQSYFGALHIKEKDDALLGTWILGGMYMFCWNKIPGDDSKELKIFLKNHFKIDWINFAKIEKKDNSEIIRVFTEKKSISLILNNEKTIVNLKMDDGKAYQLVVKTENGKLNIYSGTKHEGIGLLKNNILAFNSKYSHSIFEPPNDIDITGIVLYEIINEEIMRGYITGYGTFQVALEECRKRKKVK